MSRIPGSSLRPRNLERDQSRSGAAQSHAFPSSGPLPQDMSTIFLKTTMGVPSYGINKLAPSTATPGLMPEPPLSRHEYNTRLPSVQQLLLPPVFTPSEASTPSTRHISEQSRPFSFGQGSPSTESIQSSSRRVSEFSVRTPLSDQSGGTHGHGQPGQGYTGSGTLTVNQMARHSTQTSVKDLSPTSPFKERFLGPQLGQAGTSQPHRLPFSSPPGQATPQGRITESFPKVYSVPCDMESLHRGPRSASPWHPPPTHHDWGTTKAGNPRKRLAQACLTCRHKKIRCNAVSNSTKCAQCERYKSECRFESRSRHGSHVTASPNEALLDSASYDGSAWKAEHSPPGDGTEQLLMAPSQKGTIFTGMGRSSTSLSGSQQAVDQSPRPLKRPRLELDSHQDQANAPLSCAESRHPSPALSPTRDLPPAVDMTDTLGLASTKWDIDPYPISPLTMEYLNLYFVYANQADCCILPRGPFQSWVRNYRDKSLDDKMILYTLMALGCRFSGRKESTVHGKRFLQIARFAEQNSCGKFTLQLAQTRLMLGLLHFSIGEYNLAWDLCGAAVRAVCALRYNTEDGVYQELGLEGQAYQLSREALAECRRRTFWSAYLMDRLNGFCSGHVSTLQTDDFFLRLPCREDLYEAQQIQRIPFLATVEQGLSGHEAASLGNMAYVIIVSTIWSDILQNLYRTKYQVQGAENGAYEPFYTEKQRQLGTFRDQLPPHLFTINGQNMQQAWDRGYMGTLICLHALYLTAQMKVNRHAAHAQVGEGTLRRNMKAARLHARETLKLMHALAELGEKQDSRERAWMFSVPFMGYSVFSAVDILTSIGLMADLRSDLALIQGSLHMVQEAGQYWASAQKQFDLIGVRLAAIVRALEKASAQYTAFFTTRSMEEPPGSSLDLLFSPPLDDRLRALEIGTGLGTENAVLCIDGLG